MPAHAADTMNIGVVATLEGPLSTLGEDVVRGIKTALIAVNNMAARADHQLPGGGRGVVEPVNVAAGRLAKAGCRPAG